MRKLSILILSVLSTFQVFAQSNLNNKTLFNGHDLSGWIMPGEIPGFEVKDGVLMAIPPNGSDLFTEEQYGNYIFRFEYFLSEVGNSGVLIRCDPENPWGTGVEVQLLAPWTPYRDDLHCTASLYGHVAVTNRPDETTGMWHEMEIMCDRKNISITVDGIEATRVNIDTVDSMQDKLLHGSIGFQSNHSKKGEYAYFRNITINNLDNDPEYVATGFADQDERIRKQAMQAAVDLGASMVNRLAIMVEDENIMKQAGAKQVLFDIVARSTAPDGNLSQQKELLKALKKSSKSLKSESAKTYMEWLMEMAG